MLYLQLRPARKNYITKILHNRIAELGNVTQAMTAIIKRLYAYDAMSAGSIIEGNYTDLPGAK